MASAKLTQVAGDYMISLVGTNMTEYLTETENAQLRASQLNPTQQDGLESQHETETPYDAPPADEPGTTTPCRVTNSQVHLRSQRLLPKNSKFLSRGIVIVEVTRFVIKS